jgi:ATP-dependent Clp protease ATP-binding subunit ClpB
LPAIDPNIPSYSETLASMLKQRLIGQDHAVDAIVPYVETFEAGLAPENRPAGVFLLLGPTGTGKTHTPEALAEVLHGDRSKVLRIDCGEFQLEHEIAKIMASPPGYLGHRETKPLITQEVINFKASASCPLSIVVFDEIEKSGRSFANLLLGILDKATMNTGDNKTVDFRYTIIFLTSNLGANDIQKATGKPWGFEAAIPADRSNSTDEQIRRVAKKAMKKRFAPEFCNRIDEIVVYKPFSKSNYRALLQRILEEKTRFLDARLGIRSFRVSVTPAAMDALLDEGVSAEYGARELRRTVERRLMRPLAACVAQQRIPPCSEVYLQHREGEFRLMKSRSN